MPTTAIAPGCASARATGAGENRCATRASHGRLFRTSSSEGPKSSRQAISSTPADMFGLDGAGRLKVGGLADVVVWDGDPLEVTSAATAVYIAGSPVAPISRQTELRDRYIDLKDAGTKPFQYR